MSKTCVFAVMVAAGLAASVSFGTDYYVAMNGDDSADGMSKATARATIAEGVKLLTAPNDRLIVCDGEYELPASGEAKVRGTTIVLSDGQSMVSENGREKTKLVVPSTVKQAGAWQLFDLTSADTVLDGFTIDFNKVDYRDITGGFVLNPQGRIQNCTIENYSTEWGNTLIRYNAEADSSVISNCVFRNCSMVYRSASVMWIATAKPLVTDCAFVDCTGGTSKYFSYGTVRVESAATFRNCLFLRCVNWDTYSPSSTSYIARTLSCSGSPSIENCAFLDCEIKGPGDLGAALGGKCKATNCFAYRCKNAYGACNLIVASNITYFHCASDIELAGEGNVILKDGDLEFANEREDRFKVLSGPVIDAGVNGDWMDGATDLAGNPRIVNDRADIGCYEFVKRPNTYYVSTDGNDAYDGLTPTTAKATIHAAVELLSGLDERVLIAAGTYADEPATTISLSNGWSIVGEEGPEKTKVLIGAAFQQLQINSPGTRVKGLDFDFNNVDYKGFTGGLVVDPQGIIENCFIQNYTHTTLTGGAPIRIADSTIAPIITGCVFRNCFANYRTSPTVHIEKSCGTQILNCRFVDCTDSKTYFGYGIIYNDGAAKNTMLRNCLFLRCTAYDSGHDALGALHLIWTKSSSTAIENCSFVDCAITGAGRGSMIGNSAKVKNTFAYNCVNSQGPANLVELSGVSYDHCASDVELAGEGNIILKPGELEFRNLREERCQVLSGPVIDAGTNLEWMTNATDIAGNPRIVNGIADIGCYEYVNQPRPTTYYVSMTGNDSNDGLTRETAKATIPAAVACLSGLDERVLVLDGTYENNSAETIVLSNGWSIVGENGAAKTRILVKSVVRQVDLQSPGTAVRGLTFDFNTVSFKDVSEAGLSNNPQGTIADCVIENYKTTRSKSPVHINDSALEPVIVGCVFRNCYTEYDAPLLLVENSKSVLISGCQFVDCSTGRYAGRGTVYSSEGCKAITLRNCLFLRCSQYDATGSVWGTMQIYFTRNSVSIVENCSFIDCQILGSGAGGMIGAAGSKLGKGTKVYNSFAYGCSNPAGPVGFLDDGPTYSHCADVVEHPGEGNVLLTPGCLKFLKKKADNYTVVRGPTVDAGTNQIWMATTPDLYGNSRIVNEIVDIGCAEFDPATYAPPGLLLLVR